MNKNTEVLNPPDANEIKNFWTTIWENDQKHNQEAKWIPN